jgi:hypothetical protein
MGGAKVREKKKTIINIALMNLWGFLLMIIPFLIAAIPFGDYSVA